MDLNNSRKRFKFRIYDKEIIVASVLILLFSIFDGVFTIWGIHYHLIEEGNPLMQVLVAEKNYHSIMIIKILLPIILGIACWWIRNSSRKLVSYGLGGIVIVYSFLMIVHLYWIFQSNSCIGFK